MSLFSLGGLEWQTSMEEGEKSAGFLFFLQRFSYTALVSMFHLSYFGLLFSMNFKAGFCFQNRRIECQKILKHRATQYKITTEIWALNFLLHNVQPYKKYTYNVYLHADPIMGQI